VVYDPSALAAGPPLRADRSESSPIEERPEGLAEAAEAWPRSQPSRKHYTARVRPGGGSTCADERALRLPLRSVPRRATPRSVFLPPISRPEPFPHSCLEDRFGHVLSVPMGGRARKIETKYLPPAEERLRFPLGGRGCGSECQDGRRVTLRGFGRACSGGASFERKFLPEAHGTAPTSIRPTQPGNAGPFDDYLALG